MATHLIGNEIQSPLDTTTQVYKATHEGTERLSLRNRSFISFTYGGRHIEDFNLLAAINGNRLQRSGYAAFNDITTNYDVIDGQFYWGTSFETNSIDFYLATDAITEKELNDFKNWFMPGRIRELVLAENPNRAIWARVSAPPSLSLLPFEKKISHMIDGKYYETSTTAYAGEITLSFIMDEPYWFSRNNVIEEYYLDTEDKFGSMTSDGKLTDAKRTLDDPDFIKVIVEDGVPHRSMIKNDPFLGDIGTTKDVGSTSPKYLYYCGTAPCRPLIRFDLRLVMNNDTNYITYPLNSYSNLALNNPDLNNYNILSIGDKQFKFTAPAAWIGYNQAINIMSKFKLGDAIAEAEAALRDGVSEYYARAWAMAVLYVMKSMNYGTDGGTIFSATAQSNFGRMMKYFLGTEGNNWADAKFSFNSKTGEGSVVFPVRVVDPEYKTDTGGQVTYPTTEDQLKALPTYLIEENAGDMVRSDYLFIDTKCSPRATGVIGNYDCLVVGTDYPSDVGGLKNVSIIYQHLYL